MHHALQQEHPDSNIRSARESGATKFSKQGNTLTLLAWLVVLGVAGVALLPCKSLMDSHTWKERI